ncbi:rhodanese [Flavobacterium cyanobacteriorum]|uniref:Rhodanese n=1 Tax=Flavobacterium cyanobacteriorum TaxID=2022802 RepID=A0A255Z3F8_9FLAO|nr:rhodanese-like domain-containing protein [Flavobacterium cyanobacteriorum]OYQ36053.1 rhodanese [Flavobacterium cyanobacteriorum]
MDLHQEEWWDKAQQDTNAVILDVRTEDEFSRGIIPGALNIDIYKGQGFIDAVDALDKSKSYYVYCAAGVRSGQACAIMGRLGFEKTHNLAGGFSQWKGPVAMP